MSMIAIPHAPITPTATTPIVVVAAMMTSKRDLTTSRGVELRQLSPHF
jgi:hypothetical protein